MKIVKVHFQIEAGALPLHYHVELDEPLPATAKLGDVITTSPHSIGSRFKLLGMRSPASNRCNVLPIKELVPC